MFFCILSQMVTYLVCNGLEYRFKVLIGRVRQATKDVVKSDVMTLRSNLGCNTQVKTRGWIESRGRKEMIQLVKHKEYRRVSTVYIPMYYEE